MIRWFASHPTAANLLLVVFIAAGSFSAPQLLRETFPDFRPVEAEITVTYRGATAEAVETGVCAPLWDAVQRVERLESFVCTAQDNRARAVATMSEGGDATRFVAALRSEVASADTLPERAEPAIVRELHRTDLVTSVAVSGDLPLPVLDRYAEDLAVRLADLPDVAQVVRTGLGTRTLSIHADRAALAQHGLTAAALAQAVGSQSLDAPAGRLDTAAGDITLRFSAEARTVEALSALPVLTLPDGAVLTLGEVARISETFEPPDAQAFLDGAPAMVLDIHKPLDADALRVLDAVSGLVDAETARLPGSVTVLVVQDVTSIIRERLMMLVENGVIGLALVVVFMSLFFRPAFAIWAAMGLPVAFLGAFLWMAVTGLSLNMMTLVALLMAIGIVMDDSIVLSDSIAVHASEVVSTGTVTAGVLAVAPGVLSSFLTTVAVFLPLSFLAGELGAVLEVLPLVLLAALAASLAEAFLILPHHLATALKKRSGPQSRLRRAVDNGFAALRDRGVGRLADLAIRARWPVLGLALGALIATAGALGGGLVQREAMPEIDGDVLEARLALPAGTPLERTRAAVAQVEAALSRVNERLSAEQPENRDLVLRSITRLGRNASMGETGPHLATISADLLSAQTRVTSLDQLIAAWRAEIGPLPGVSSLILREPGIGPQGIAVELRLSHPDLLTLERAGRATLAELDRYLGVRNATLDLRPGRPELRLQLSPGARMLGLTAAEVARQLGAAYLGTSLTEIRQDDLSFAVEVVLQDADRDSLSDLDDFAIALPDGATVPLGSVAHLEEARGWSSITRRDGRRVVTVQADVDGRLGNADAITARLAAGFLPELAASLPGLTHEIAGQAASSAETVASILRGFLIGIVGVYLVLSFQFRSYVEPIIVMLTIPLAFLGVVWGHVAMGYNISMPSLVGAASLAGIVVNNAILLVGVIRDSMARGRDVAGAAGDAVRARFRPIFVSVATTVLGMAPLLAETSTQAQTLKPLVISVVFGLLASMVLTLLVLPAFYAILADLGLSRSVPASPAESGRQPPGEPPAAHVPPPGGTP